MKDTTTLSNILFEQKAIILNEDDTYAEVFDSLNVETPPPLPSRKASRRAPVRPLYPSTMINYVILLEPS